MSLDRLHSQLQESVGPGHVDAVPVACARFAVGSISPALVVAPGSVDELSEVIAAAHENGVRVVPWGGGTRQRIGSGLAAAGSSVLVVRTERLNRIVEHEPGDLTVCVEAGIRMAALDSILAGHAQMLPVDVALPEQSTLGGALATAADGPRRLGYGTFRDLLIGIRVVEATGRVSKAGGRVVKNVSGFDLMKLYLGSLGTLAVIVSANFKLIPRPRAAATIVCTFASRKSAFDFVTQIHGTALTPAACEYLEGTDLNAATWKTNRSADNAEGATLAVLAEGLSPAVERHLRELRSLAERSDASCVEVRGRSEHSRLWSEIADLSQTRDVPDDELVVRLSCLPGNLEQAITHAAVAADSLGLALRVDARALSGVGYLRARASTKNDVEGVNQLASWLREIRGRGLEVTVLAWPGLRSAGQDLKASIATWGTPREGIELMRRIKREFDPTGILNPGRFVV